MSSEREKRTQLMETGEVKKTLVFLGIPSIVAMMINAVYNFVDTMFIGMLNDTSAMGAVSIVFPIFLVLGALGQMIGVGSASASSRYLGNKRNDLADKTATIALIIAFIISAMAMVGGMLFLKPMLVVMGATNSMMGFGMGYGKWIVLGAIFTITNMVLNNLVRAEGNAKYSMNALILGAVVNVVLDPIFIFVFKGGVEGASIATMIGQACSTVYLLSYYLKKKSFINIDFKLLKSTSEEESREILSNIFKIGIPVFLMQFLYSIASTLLNSSAAQYGDSAVAAMGINARIYMIPLYTLLGYIQGFQPFTSYNYGAKNYSRVKEGIRFSLVLLIGCAMLFWGLFQFVPQIFVGIFTKDPEVLAMGVNAIKAITLALPGVAFIMVYTAVFQALGKGAQAGILAVGRQGLFLIPMVLVLPKIFEGYQDSLSFIMNILPNEMPAGLYGLMLAQPTSDMLGFVIAIVLALLVSKELKALEAQDNGASAENLEEIEI